jgi:hypothetical protein
VAWCRGRPLNRSSASHRAGAARFVHNFTFRGRRERVASFVRRSEHQKDLHADAASISESRLARERGVACAASASSWFSGAHGGDSSAANRVHWWSIWLRAMRGRRGALRMVGVAAAIS